MPASSRHRTPLLIGMALVLAVVSGCDDPATTAGEAPVEDVSETWRVEIDRLLSGGVEGVGEVHHEILADYRISEAEYAELEGMLENAEGITQGESMRRCLDQGAVEEFSGLSGDELERMTRAVELHPTTPEAMVCFLDPFGTQGLTLEEAEGILPSEEIDRTLENHSDE